VKRPGEIDEDNPVGENPYKQYIKPMPPTSDTMCQKVT